MAYTFNGSTEYLTGNSPLSGDQVALVCWANSASGPQDNQYPICMGDSVSADNQGIMFDTNGSVPQQVRAIEYDGGYKLAGTGIAWTASIWEHCVAIFNANNDRRIFLRGANKATNTTATITDPLDRLTIGCRDQVGATAFFNGTVAEFKSYGCQKQSPGAVCNKR